MPERYAFYFSPPPHSELAAFGKLCLGRTAFRARQSDAKSTFADQARWQTLTTKPAHYGFHATLKAPFELKQNVSVKQLIDTAQAFVSKEAPITLTTLAPRLLSQFLALTLEEQPDTVASLAQRCVETFEGHRLPLSNTDIQHRLQQPLSDRQTTLLQQYGYPYVAEQFRFHMTLSGELPNQDNDFLEWVSETFQSIVTCPPVLDRITLFWQTDRQSPFVHLNDFPFEQL